LKKQKTSRPLDSRIPQIARALVDLLSWENAQAAGELPLAPTKLQMAGHIDFCHTTPELK
jgi:hypothetical protein